MLTSGCLTARLGWSPDSRGRRPAPVGAFHAGVRVDGPADVGLRNALQADSAAAAGEMGIICGRSLTLADKPVPLVARPLQMG